MCTVKTVLPQLTKSPRSVSPSKLVCSHTQEPYPNNITFLGDVCDFSGIAENESTAKSRRYIEWQCTMKWHVNRNTMSSSLIHDFLSLMHGTGTFKNSFLSVHITYPKMEFQDCFQWSIDKYRHCPEQD